MSTAVATGRADRLPSPTARAVRLLLVNTAAGSWWPWAILGISFVVNLLIFLVAGDGIPADQRTTYGIASLYVTVLVAHLQTWTQVFPFALGLSLTRTAFFRGAALLAVAEAVLAGVVLFALKVLEWATDGWGLSLRFFAPPYVARDDALAQLLVYAAPYLALCAIGTVLGVVLKRWGQTGLWLLAVGAIAALGGAAVLVTWRGWWGQVGRFLTDSDPLALLVAGPTLLACAAGATAYLLVRRTSP